MKRYFQLLFYFIITLQIGCKDKFEDKDGNQSAVTINGKWEVTETSYTYFDHPSSCNSLGINCIFNFDNGNFNLYKDKNSGSCLYYPQTYRVDSSVIRFCEIDMVFDYKIINLTSDELVLNSINIVPRSLYNGHVIDDDTDLVSRLSKNGITIKLKRI